jgi:putative flippase GtrA
MVTGLHIVIAVALIRHAALTPSLANGGAFVCATIASYLVNTLWSFSQPLHGKNLARFLVVASIGLLISMGVSAGAEYLGLHYLLGIAAVVVTVPVVTFLLHATWTYR